MATIFITVFIFLVICTIIGLCKTASKGEDDND